MRLFPGPPRSAIFSDTTKIMTSPANATTNPQPLPGKKRRELHILILIVVMVGTLILRDPHHFFEWLSARREAQVDEFLLEIVIIGTAFAFYSWRRWTELSKQVAEYRRLQAELSQVNVEATLLSETGELLQTCITSEEACKVIIRHINYQFPGSSGAICLIASTRDIVQTVATWGSPSLREKIFTPQECWALRRGRVTIMDDNEVRLGCGHIGSDPPRYSICIPMMAQCETVGVLYLDSGLADRDSGEPTLKLLSNAQQRLLKTLGEHLAMAIANINLRETLRNQSIRDPLTDLFNRRYLEEFLSRELRRSTRKGQQLSVIMVDVDHFKRFNDSFGHEAGDLLLQELASLFRRQLRAEDIACRYGGEEFTLILADAPTEVVRKRAEQLRLQVKALQLQYLDAPLGPVSISIGIASFTEHGSTTTDLLRAADSALYKAKEEGRDRVLIA